MRPISKLTMCALAGAVIASSAAAASSDYFLKLGDVKGESAARAGGGKQLEIESWSWGATNAGAKGGNVEFEWKVEEGESAPPAPGGVRVATGDVNGDGRAADKFGAVGGAHRDDGVTSPRDAASGMPTGKRQHRPVTITKPLDRGSVRVKVRFPWLDCRVGAAFPDAVLQNAAGRFELKDVVISGCAREGVALNYKKVTVRGWNPETKE